jgi:hypothetical protein
MEPVEALRALARISHAAKKKPPIHAIKLSVENNFKAWEAAA